MDIILFILIGILLAFALHWLLIALELRKKGKYVLFTLYISLAVVNILIASRACIKSLISYIISLL